MDEYLGQVLSSVKVQFPGKPLELRKNSYDLFCRKFNSKCIGYCGLQFMIGLTVYPLFWFLAEKTCISSIHTYI